LKKNLGESKIFYNFDFQSTFDMNENPLDSLNEIKSMMERSSKFTNISGWTWIWVGFVGLISASIAYFIILEEEFRLYTLLPNAQRDINLVILLISTLIVACAGGFYFMINKTNKDGAKFINPTTKRILARFILVLLIGATICAALYMHLSFVYIAPTTLLFYGLALLNVEKDTILEIKYLAYSEIILGLLAFFLIYKGLLFWTIGFGLIHLIFGVWMVLKYDNKA